VTQAPALLKDATSTSVLADKGYDSDAIVAQIEAQGSRAVIPPRRGRRVERPYDRDLFKSRFVVEQFFARIKRCRRVATRYEKLAVTFLGMVLLACILVWLAELTFEIRVGSPQSEIRRRFRRLSCPAAEHDHRWSCSITRSSRSIVSR